MCRGINWPTKEQKKTVKEEKCKVYEDFWQKFGIKEAKMCILACSVKGNET